MSSAPVQSNGSSQNSSPGLKSDPKPSQILVVEDESDVRNLMLLHLKRSGYLAVGVQSAEEALQILSKSQKTQAPTELVPGHLIDENAQSVQSGLPKSPDLPGTPGLKAMPTHAGLEHSPEHPDSQVELVVLDWMLPGLSGLELCKLIHNEVSVLMLTARADTTDIIEGLNAGADDYVSKPFEIPVFLARVSALLRRVRKHRALLPNTGNDAGNGTSNHDSPKHPLGSPLKSTVGDSIALSGSITHGALVINFDSHQAFCGQDKIALSPSEFNLLRALMLNQGRALSREKLIGMVQGLGVSVVDRAIDTHVFGLRKKLGPCGDLIETIRGVGYRISG